MSLRDLFGGRRREARKVVEHLLRCGLIPFDEIAFQTSLLIEDELDETVLNSIVSDAWKDLRRELTADKPAALDRLSKAFAALESSGVLARHYPLAGRSEAYDLIVRELSSAARRGQNPVGFCFYDQFSVKEMTGGGLTFCFGCAEDFPTYARLWTNQRAVGQKITKALNECGFQVCGTVILVTSSRFRTSHGAGGGPMTVLRS